MNTNLRVTYYCHQNQSLRVFQRLVQFFSFIYGFEYASDSFAPG